MAESILCKLGLHDYYVVSSVGELHGFWVNEVLRCKRCGCTRKRRVML